MHITSTISSMILSSYAHANNAWGASVHSDEKIKNNCDLLRKSALPLFWDLFQRQPLHNRAR